MESEITLMTASVIAEHIDLDASLADKIRYCHPRADILYIDMPVEVLKKSRDRIEIFMQSGKKYNKDAYGYIIK